MDIKFRSKVGWWYHLLMILIAFGCIVAFLQPNIWWIVGMIFVAVLTIHVLLNTWYKITKEGLLIIHCSIFPEKKIMISAIQAVEPTMLPASSYALSLDRLMLWVDDKPWIIVSPKNKNEFVKRLQTINPEIVIKKSDSLF